MKQLIERLHLTREKLEILSIIVIVVCGLSVFSVLHQTKASLSYDNGKITYTGYVKNNQMSGYGKLRYDNGDTYTGEFVRGVFDGKGSFVSSNGWSYTGDFKKGAPDGEGELKAKNKKVYKGKFKQGIYQK